MSLLDAIKHAAFEDEAPAPKPVAKPTSAFHAATQTYSPGAAAPAPAFSPTPNSSIPNYGAPAPVVVDEAVYQHIFEKTDFENTSVMKTIHKYLDAMANLPLDQNTKFKTAVTQAQSIDHITPDQILGAFDTLKATLQSEATEFSSHSDTFTQQEITARQTKLQSIADTIARKQKEIADLQATHTQVSAELANATATAANAQTQFQLATQRRSNEIDQQKAQFASLLR
jgi:Rps23 Pro-64 3,4-dihydroxylase Tpa1-like proline 4-hydroxylase